MKRIISSILILALSLSLFAGCKETEGTASGSDIPAVTSGNISQEIVSTDGTANSGDTPVTSGNISAVSGSEVISGSEIVSGSSVTSGSEVISNSSVTGSPSGVVSDTASNGGNQTVAQMPVNRNDETSIISTSIISSNPKFSIPDDDYVIPPETNEANLYYYYNQLPDYLKDSYIKLVIAIANCKMTCQLDIEPTEAELNVLYTCITYDHPQFFHMYSYEQPNHITHSPNDKSLIYIMYDYQVSESNASPDIDEIEDIFEQIQNVAKAPLYEANKYSSVYDKVTYLYYWLVDETEISWSNYNAHPHSTIKELLVDKHGVCIGYALTLSYLYRQLGITTTVGTGINSSNVEHTWCIAKLNGKYYACDAYFANEHRVNFEHSSAEYLLMDSYDKEVEMQVTPYSFYKGPTLG